MDSQPTENYVVEYVATLVSSIPFWPCFIALCVIAALITIGVSVADAFRERKALFRSAEFFTPLVVATAMFLAGYRYVTSVSGTEIYSLPSFDQLLNALGGSVFLVSAFTFLLMVCDKWSAMANSDKTRNQQSWRVKESTLHWCELMGGSPGSLLAQTMLSHKSSKRDYQAKFWMIVAFQLVSFLVILQFTS